MQVHPITLAFNGSNKALEGPFKLHYFQSTLLQVRIAVMVAAIFYSAYGFIDVIAVPQHKYLFWTLRWGLVLPVSMMMLAFTFTPYAFRFMQPALAIGTMINGAVIILMIMAAPEDKQFTYLSGLVQILFYVYTLLRIRFIWASSCFSLLFLGYIAGALITGRIPSERLVSDMAFLFGINLMGMLACYAIEYYTRKGFFLSRQLETKKRRLDLVNRFLEKRVEKRTSELMRANKLLENEIKERKEIEKALQENKIRYRRMVNNVTDYMCVHDMNGSIREVNYRMISGLGYSHKEIVGRNLQDLMVPEQRPQFAHYLNRLRQGQKAMGKVTFISRDGQLRLMEYSSIMAQHTGSGDVIYCLARDITERQQTEKALAESQAHFKDIFETAAAGMMIVNSDTQSVVEVNPAAAQMIQESAESIKGRLLGQLIMNDFPDDPPSAARLWADVDPVECNLVGSKTTIPILKTMRPMEFNGDPNWLISFISLQKIKEAEAAKREAEAQLNRSQHLQAIGTLAGGIAHDFNNILYGVIGFAQLAIDDAPSGSQLHDNLQEILRGSRRAKDLIGQILTFSRQNDTEKKPIQPTPLIKEALKLLRASIPATIEIQADIAPHAATILANPTQIHQVVMNLCTNAAQAMLPQGGHLRVVLNDATVETEELGLHGPVAAGKYVRLSVIDNGCGIPENLKDRIFEPFFTTKTQGQGTGMGLSVVLGVVQAHQGAIRLLSEPGKGTRFDILLPAATSSKEMAVEDNQQTPGGRERILLVDDETALVHMGRQMLSRLGYHVTACQDPIEALDLFRSNPDNFDLVITDLTMPKIKGTKLAQHLLHLKPDLPIILCTGYGDQVTTEQIEDIGIRELLLKPILRHQLAVTIRHSLEAVH
ncbi:MAG: PAS domain S-box protein [Desulfobacteraceae bacterium]|nr:MAG: PAS domain S-box protein [Desulfobacteraceae bacterium]